MPHRKSVDPVTAEIIRGGLYTIANEMSDTVIRTARTSTFSESHDFSTSIFDGKGRLISVSAGLPMHMIASRFSVMEVLKDFGDNIYPGDVFVLNDPYHGGSHIPDWTIMIPIFHNEEILFFPVTRAHQGDTGGAAPGGYYPGATDIWQEGLRLPPIKIYEKGVSRPDIIKMLQINTREPRFWGDLQAMIASIKIGEKRLLEMLNRYGARQMVDYTGYLIDYTDKRFRAEIETWPDGVYEADAYLEHDCQGITDIKIKVKATVNKDSLKLDFSGSDPQVPGFVNSPLCNSYAFIFVALASMIDETIPHNDGLFNPVEIYLPEGTVVNPKPPAPCTACTLHIGGEIAEAVAFALGNAVPERAYVQNVKQGMPIVTFGVDPETAEMFIDQNTNTSGGWCNATSGLDGWGALPCYFGAMTMATAELHDMDYPNFTIEREYVTDSGGPGKWRGGLGTLVKQKATSPMYAHTYLIGTSYPMRGFNGGMDGSPNQIVLRAGSPNELIVKDTAFNEILDANDILIAELGGGGGWGNPLERNPAAVLDDVIDEYVSFESALRDYGVVIDKDTLQVDDEATKKLRAKLTVGS